MWLPRKVKPAPWSKVVRPDEPASESKEYINSVEAGRRPFVVHHHTNAQTDTTDGNDSKRQGEEGRPGTSSPAGSNAASDADTREEFADIAGEALAF